MDVPGVGQEKNNKIHPNDWVIYPKTTLPISQFELIQPPHFQYPPPPTDFPMILHPASVSYKWFGIPET